MTDTWYGNGKLLAETIKKEFSNEIDVNITDVKETYKNKNPAQVMILRGLWHQIERRCPNGPILLLAWTIS